MAGLGNGYRHPLPWIPSKSHAADGNWLRLAPGDPGHILVDLSPATRWELGLNDAGGRHVAGFRGVGPGSRTLGASTLAPGTYFLTGKAGGRLQVQSFHVPSSP